MPLDPMMSNAILGTFKNMVEDCKQKNISGDDYDKMCETYARMEHLAQEHSDMNAFNGQVMQENLYGKFGDYYGKALSAQSQKDIEADSGNYSDASLLKMTLDALKQCIVSLQQSYKQAIDLGSGKHAKKNLDASLDYIGRNAETLGINAGGGMEDFRNQSEKSFNESLKETPNAYDSSVEIEILQNPEDLIKPIQDLINLGEQVGMTYPNFLRIQIETGLDKAAEGAVTARKSLIVEQEFANATPISPYHLKKIELKIKGFDELSAKNKFNIPNWKEFSFLRDEVDREFEPDIQKWNRIKDMWDKMLWDLYIWSLSYCSFAPYIKPWSLAKDPVAATIKTQNVEPGIFKEREKLLKKYFGMSFYDIFKHPTFLWDVKYHYFFYSQEFTEFLIEKIYPNCEPFKHLNSDLIQQRASFYKKDRNTADRELNPLGHMPAERMRLFYNNKFGEGRYESKFKTIEKNDSQAAEWNLENFKYNK